MKRRILKTWKTFSLDFSPVSFSAAVTAKSAMAIKEYRQYETIYEGQVKFMGKQRLKIAVRIYHILFSRAWSTILIDFLWQILSRL